MNLIKDKNYPGKNREGRTRVKLQISTLCISPTSHQVTKHATQPVQRGENESIFLTTPTCVFSPTLIVKTHNQKNMNITTEGRTTTHNSSSLLSITIRPYVHYRLKHEKHQN